MPRTKAILRWVLAAAFVLAGLNHFRVPAVYLGMIPPALPDPAALNAISGAAEILGGVGLALPRFRRGAAWGLIALLVAIFPANVHVALQGHMDGLMVSPAVLWWRLPFQAVFVALVGWAGLGPD